MLAGGALPLTTQFDGCGAWDGLIIEIAVM